MKLIKITHELSYPVADIKAKSNNQKWGLSEDISHMEELIKEDYQKFFSEHNTLKVEVKDFIEHDSTNISHACAYYEGIITGSEEHIKDFLMAEGFEDDEVEEIIEQQIIKN